jgi:hypothetical protein
MTQDTESDGATPGQDEPKTPQVTGAATDDLDNAAEDQLAVADEAAQAVLDTSLKAELAASEVADETRQQVAIWSTAEVDSPAIQAGAETSRLTFAASVTAATQALTTFNQEAVEALRANTNASFDLWTSLAGARTWSEAMTLNAEHMRKQTQALSKQSQELSGLAQRIAVKAIEPLRSSMFRPFA